MGVKALTTLLQLPKKVVIPKKHALAEFKNMEKINPFDKLRVSGEQSRTIKSFFRNILTKTKAFFSRFTKGVEKSQ